MSKFIVNEKPLPVELWGLEPSFWIYKYLLISELKNLPLYSGGIAISYDGLPIINIQIVGIITSIKNLTHKKLISISDVSDAIYCSVDEIKIKEIKLGNLVKVEGKINIDFITKRRIIIIERIIKYDDPNMESYWLARKIAEKKKKIKLRRSI